MNKKLEEEYIRKLRVWKGADTELAHLQADRLIGELLTKLGYEKVIEEYGKIEKWYS